MALRRLIRAIIPSTRRPSRIGFVVIVRATVRIDALWDLIALPTLNLSAAEASLALAVKVFRTGLLEEAGAETSVGRTYRCYRLARASANACWTPREWRWS